MDEYGVPRQGLSSTPPERPACVLIVDDERANRDLLKVMLAPEGLLLLTASSGEEALALLDTTADLFPDY